MPITRQAEKKLRHDRKITLDNAKKKHALRTAIKEFRKKPMAKTLPSVYKTIDKAVKVRLIHKNKAARLKSRLTTLVSKK